jgi:putative heme-binding domain-containing protein
MLAQQADMPDVQKNPFAGNPGAVAAGKKLYDQTCQACHGADAQGGRGPSLASGNFKHGSEDNDLFRTIRTGVPGTQMPAFSLLPSDDVWRMITYLRSLNANGAAANETVTGNVAAGQEIFWGKGGCARCHEVNARGTDIGPDLSDAGKNSAAYLRGVIANPNATTGGPQRWFRPSAVTVKTRDGEEVTGMQRAQDNYTLIMTDLSGNLRKFDRKDILTERNETKSLMPGNYSQLLSPSETEDLIAYLKSLKARDLIKTLQVGVPGGLSFARLRNAEAEPQNWLTH